MYLYIFEDGTIKKANKITGADFQSVKDGYLTILDISIPDTPTEYWPCQDKWIEINHTVIAIEKPENSYE